MSEQYPNYRELEFAINNLQRHEQELDTQQRLILRAFKKMAVDEQKELTSHLLERAQHYNNSIIAAGYTAFFAAWAFFKDQVHGPFYDASLLLVFFSVVAFVLWNVFSNITMSRDLFQKAELIGRNLHDPLYLFEALGSFNKEQIQHGLDRRVWWRISLYMSIVPGALGAALFFYIVGSDILSRSAVEI